MSVRMWIKGNLCALLVRMEVRTATIENSMEVPQKLKTEIPYDSVVLLLGIYISKRNKNKISKRYIHSHVY